MTPQLDKQPDSRSTARPTVARRVNYRGVWLFLVVLTIAAISLFSNLSARREKFTAPSIAPGANEDGSTITSPPELTIPPVVVPVERERLPLLTATPSARPQIVEALRQQPPVPQNMPTESESPVVIRAPMTIAPSSAPLQPSGPQIVYQASATPALPTSHSENGSGKEVERVRAERFANPATTIPKGTVLQAVLESALDSTRPGFARAIISRDVFGFDGTRVLIPRGSRLIGDYKADLATGQHRALIEWQRLMRPDGVVIDLDSPSADPLGRAGIEGKVNTHFVARFAGAILQTALTVGSEVGVSKLAGGTAFVALPVGQQSTPLQAPDRVQPTLTVKQGSSVSVFVARDLDFTSVEQ